MNRSVWGAVAMTLCMVGYPASAQTFKHRSLAVDNGNVLLGLASPRKLVDVDAACATDWSAGLTDKAYVAYRLANGHFFVAKGMRMEYRADPENGRVFIPGTVPESGSPRGFFLSEGRMIQVLRR